MVGIYIATVNNIYISIRPNLSWTLPDLMGWELDLLRFVFSLHQHIYSAIILRIVTSVLTHVVTDLTNH